jgi:alpha,alpha-trehalase
LSTPTAPQEAPLARRRSLWLALGEVAARLDRARTLAVASDFDGTLTPIVPRPEGARLDARARRVLARLAARPRTRVAILSGRGLEDLRRRLGAPGIHLAGASGLESLDVAGRRTRHVPAGRGLPAALRASLEAWCRRFPGAWVEDKGATLAVHLRSVAPAQRAPLAAGVRRRAARLPRPARLVRGLEVFEILPDVAWDKSAALARWLRGLRDPLVLYFGDDTVDEPVHAAVRARGGLAVAVGERASQAEFSLADPRQVVWFLEWLEREWREGSPPGYRARATSGRPHRRARGGGLAGRPS